MAVRELQIPPLRYAPVGMTKEMAVSYLDFGFRNSSRGVLEPFRLSSRPERGMGRWPTEGNENLFSGFLPRLSMGAQPSPLSSRPERTRISYFAALNNGHVCDSPQREPHEAYRSSNSPQEIRGSGVERFAVLPNQSEHVFRQSVTRISYLAALNDGHACDSLKREAHEVGRSRRPQQEIPGSAVEGSAVLLRLSGAL